MDCQEKLVSKDCKSETFYYLCLAIINKKACDYEKEEKPRDYQR